MKRRPRKYAGASTSGSPEASMKRMIRSVGYSSCSEGRFTARAKIWVRGFHERGTTWGAINNLADIPYFASARESRLLQAADFVAHAVWLLYERRDSRLIRPLINCFDERQGTLHGLVHVRPATVSTCDCPACACRRTPGNLGTWLQPRGADPISPGPTIPPASLNEPKREGGEWA